MVEPSDAPTWSLAACRTTGADCEGRGQDLYDRDSPGDEPTLAAHREHDLGDTVALRGRCVALDKWPVDEARYGGGQQQEQPRCPAPDAVRLPNVGRVLVEAGRHPRPPANREVKQNRCRADNRANERGGHAEQGPMGGDCVADANARPRSRVVRLRGLR